ncbi:hypothetical protein JKP88DRAFT_272875 [Tribonema minus]|uniref:Uncharacterized protein n=1 Tax=Tribonema minus TaxID=303371 RepID=A0A836CEL1_9STRA|nr:hypothetical protein JKP88DRAFT_272875 [Tribonema minus]
MVAALAAAGAHAAVTQDPKNGNRGSNVLLGLVGLAAVAGLAFWMHKTIREMAAEIRNLREELDIAQLSADEVAAIASEQIEKLLAEEVEVVPVPTPIPAAAVAEQEPTAVAPPLIEEVGSTADVPVEIFNSATVEDITEASS